MSDFVLADVVTRYSEKGDFSSAPDLSRLSSDERKDKLNELIDSISTNPDAVLEESTYELLQSLTGAAETGTSNQIKHLIDLISGSLTQKALQVAAEPTDELEPSSTHRSVLEILALHLSILLTTIQTRKFEISSENDTSKSKAKTKRQKDSQASLDVAALLEPAFDAMSKVLSLRAAKLWPTTAERDVFVSLFTKPAYLVAENEALMKNQRIKMRVYKIVCVAIKHHGHAFGAQTTIVQNLQYFEHLSEPMAELLQILSEQYDYPQLTDEILRELSNQEFNANDNKGPKSVSAFLIRISELMPRQVLKQITLLAKFLDCEAHVLRSAIIEVCGNLIVCLSNQDEADAAESHKAQINGFFDLLEERFLDSNPYCRSKVLQTYIKVCDLPRKYPKRRQIVCELAIRSLEDKSSNVRRNAIKLLAKLMQTHQFGALHGPLLTQKDWHERLLQTQKEIDILTPTASIPEEEPDSDLFEGPTSPVKAHEPDASQVMDKLEARQALMEKEQKLNQLQMLKKFYSEATRFVDALMSASELIIQLLASRTKTEVIEAMDFFVAADAYKIECSRSGIRRMLHLIWTKATSDEGKGVTTHLLECYRGLYFDTPAELSTKDATNFVAKNMISLTYGATLAELTSLEQLMKVMMKDGQISEDVIGKLWQVFGVQKRDISKNQRRGAIIILGMLALANREVILNGLDVLLQVAFGVIGKKDLGLMRYACIALQRLGSSEKQNKGELRKQSTKLPNDHGIFTKLCEIITTYCSSKEWFGVAEQALNAIYALAEHPDTICSTTIKQMARQVFRGASSTPPQSPKSSVEDDEEPAEMGTPRANSKAPEKHCRPNHSARALADLLFVVGHVSIKQIVYMDECEAEFKRRKAEAEKARSLASTDSAAAKDELDQVTGATEDAFTEHMLYIREHELLFGDKKDWILAKFGPLVVEICKNNTKYQDETLQSCATMALAKFMCVSGKFCEQNLSLLLLILEKSTDATTRSNLVIAMGDMTVCHNQVLDGCSDHLYARLRDDDATVKKTCLMTLTFLVLAGQVKVKGQLGEMAKCLEDDDRRIADLARMFFTELSTKDNAIYNGFTDIFSLLSAGNEELEEDTFKRIIKFLMTFIEKDKYAKQLADKLASRLSLCQTQRQFDDCIFALGCLPPTAKSESVQKIMAEGWQFAVTA
ncbi:Condensin complex subunit 1 [Taphrina deformans PYCC 5710]|uniref:Condensin complex subunit 1 n=1 Tax=Taphrina deformans (strain PYCC 5710 / ATCC 11124 / CBS 356.35 / IMI 108563 / JCM 9778 / NBRC 8474) TaxID=1097556 RepID=R4XEP6_TAPDE|nr:Condensin complex subunit 1 [Taphrina deformans PYCC 5710]|eukprot:CCG81842.1 Condensin complex subunit 1 [Taphrina deformans PYCC 5710]